MSEGVIHVHGEAQLLERLNGSENRLVVVDWFAPWCGPCRRIAPEYAAMSHRYPAVVFVSVDTEDGMNNREMLGMKYGIRAFPTFSFHLNGSEIERFSGASVEKLESTIQRLNARAEDEQMAAAIRMSMEQPSQAPQNESTTDGSSSAQAELQALLENLTALDLKDPEPTDGGEIELKVKRVSGDVTPVSVNSKASVQHLRRKVARKFETSLESIRLIFKGKILKDDATLASYSIDSGDLTIHLAISSLSKQAASTVASVPKPAVHSSSSPVVLKLRQALAKLQSSNSKQQARDAVTVILLYVKNVISHPDDVKFRSIRVGNAKFSSKIASCSAGIECMHAIGFESKDRDGESYLVLNASVSSADMAALRDELSSFAEKVAPGPVDGSTSTPAPSAAPSPANPFPSANSNPFAAFGNPGANFPSMFGQAMGGGAPFGNDAFSRIDPNMLQAFQNNPQLQAASGAMMERLMRNPELMSSMMSAMSSGQDPMNVMLGNPALMQEIMGMMADPNMQRAMFSAGMGSGMGGGMGGFPAMSGFPFPSNSPSSNPTNTTSTSAANSNTSSSTAGSSTSTDNSNSNNAQDRQNKDDDDLDDLDDIYAD